MLVKQLETKDKAGGDICCVLMCVCVRERRTCAKAMARGVVYCACVCERDREINIYTSP